MLGGAQEKWTARKSEAMEKGHAVKVLETFRYSRQTIVQKGSYGVIRTTDGDGDALIDFFVEGQSGATFAQWVCKNYFYRLEVKAWCFREESCFIQPGSP